MGSLYNLTAFAHAGLLVAPAEAAGLVAFARRTLGGRRLYFKSMEDLGAMPERS